ncbi:MAG: putative PEP-binding protein, partial [Nanoarchaeota archaeon]
ISVDEIKQVKVILKKLGIENLILGVMVETPAAVQIIEQLCEEGIKFISLGTNDLTQYTLAVDRNNENVQYLYNELHPAVLDQIAYVIETCKKYGVKTSICGQAGSNKEMAKFLVRHGIDSISVNADAAAEISAIVKELEETLIIEDKTENVLQESIENIPEKNADNIGVAETSENKRLEEFVASDEEVVKRAVEDTGNINNIAEALPITESVADKNNLIAEEAEIPEIVEEKNFVEEIPLEAIPPELFESSDRELKEELEREKSIPTERLLDIY